MSPHASEAPAKHRAASVINATLPVPAELEWIHCPLCADGAQERLLEHDSFGFPVGLSRCAGCGFVYSNPRPTLRHMQRFYRTTYLAFYEGSTDFDDEYIEHHRLREAAADRLGRYSDLVPAGGAVLDIGTGAGLFLAALRDVKPGMTLHGIEPGQMQATFAKERLGLDVFEGVYEDYRPTGPYDLITAFHVAEHLHDLPGFFAFCRARLKPNGFLAIESPNLEGDWDSFGMFHIAHLQVFTPATLSRFAAQHGFATTRSKTSNSGWDSPNLHLLFHVADGVAEALTGALPLRDDIRLRLQQLPQGRIHWILKSWAKLALHYLGFGRYLDRWRDRRRARRASR